VYLFCGFFFQAEDGIRDYKVTGVQTCALPIFVDVDYLFCFHSAVDAATGRRQEPSTLLQKIGKSRWSIDGGRRIEPAILIPEEHSILCLAEPRRIGQYGCEYRLELTRRAGDNPQNFRSCGLLL